MIFANSLKNSDPFKVLVLSKRTPSHSLSLSLRHQMKLNKQSTRTITLNHVEIVFSHFNISVFSLISQFSMNKKVIDGK